MEEQKKPESDEIDLNSLLDKIGQGLKSTWITLIRFLALIRRVPLQNKFSFILIIIASVAVGALYSTFLKKDYYETRMVLSCDYFNKRLVDDMVDKLDKLAKERQKTGIARVLHLSDTLAKNIIGFDVDPFVVEEDIIELEVLKEQLRNAQLNSKNEQVIGEVIRRIEIENRHAFSITVRTANPSFIPNLQEAIVQHFRDNLYIKKRIDVNKMLLETKARELGKDAARLDSLKIAYYKSIQSMARNGQGSNNIVLSDKTTSAVEPYQQGIYIYNELEIVNKKLILQDDFEVVNGFTEFSEPSSAPLLMIVIESILIGIVVAYLEVALRSFNNYLATVD